MNNLGIDVIMKHQRWAFFIFVFFCLMSALYVVGFFVCEAMAWACWIYGKFSVIVLLASGYCGYYFFQAYSLSRKATKIILSERRVDLIACSLVNAGSGSSDSFIYRVQLSDGRVFKFTSLHNAQITKSFNVYCAYDGKDDSITFIKMGDDRFLIPSKRSSVEGG